jgi:hypothetical protein
VHNVEKCQVLILGPTRLDAMLLSPRWRSMVARLRSLSRSFVMLLLAISNPCHDCYSLKYLGLFVVLGAEPLCFLRYVILDEIHFLGIRDGEAWERVLLVLKCPFLALSATLGNKEALVDWLNSVHTSKAVTSTPVPDEGTVEGALEEQDRLAEVALVEAVGKGGKKDKKVVKKGAKDAKVPTGGWQKNIKKGAKGDAKDAPVVAEEAVTVATPTTPGVSLVHHSQRWCDLNKFLFLPAAASAEGSEEKTDTEDASDMLSLHPIYAFALQHGGVRSLPTAIDLSPREAILLYWAMRQAVAECAKESGAPSSLAAALAALEPSTFFLGLTFMRRGDATRYARALTETMAGWAMDERPEAARTVELLSRPIEVAIASMEKQALESAIGSAYNRDFLKHNFMPLLASLRARRALPALVFTLNQATCEQLVTHATKTLEQRQKETEAIQQCYVYVNVYVCV